MQSVNLGMLLVPLAACNGKIDNAVDGSNVTDAGNDASWECGQLDASPVVTKCDDATKAACQAWSQSLVHNGKALSSCADDDAAAFPPVGCVAASECHLIAQDVYSCSCGNVGGTCLMGNGSFQVCVSDDTAPAGHCVTACSE